MALTVERKRCVIAAVDAPLLSSFLQCQRLGGVTFFDQVEHVSLLDLCVFKMMHICAPVGISTWLWNRPGEHFN